MRVLGIDYGEARIGLALSDSMGIIASALQTIKNKGEDVMEQLANIVAQNQVNKVVIGLPMNMDGSEGERAAATRSFGQELESHLKLEVSYIDERLTTKAAERVLVQAEVRRNKRNALIDKMAAQIILQAYLDKSAYMKN